MKVIRIVAPPALSTLQVCPNEGRFEHRTEGNDGVVLAVPLCVE